MPDSLRDRITAVLENHRHHGEPNPLNNWCMCGSYNETAWREHVADAVIAALGLRQERVELLTRYVTDWSQEDG